MELFYSRTSPYARKVLMLAMEQQLTGQLQVRSLHPLDDGQRLAAVNPLGKVPALVTDEGKLVVDSPVICAYLDTLATEAGRPSLLGADRAQRQRVQELQALADGIKDAAFLLVMEAARPSAQQSRQWQRRWTDAIRRTLDYLEVQRVTELSAGPAITLAEIAMACALGYLDFRHAALQWRKGHDQLARWFDNSMVSRPSFMETRPPA